MEPSSGGIGNKLKTASVTLIVAAYEKNVISASRNAVAPALY